MKFLNKLIFITLFGMWISNAQTAHDPWRLTVATSSIDIYTENVDPSTGVNNYDNAEFNDLLELVNQVQVARYLSPSFSLEATGTFNRIHNYSPGAESQHYTLDAGLLMSLRGIKKFKSKLGKFDPALKGGLSYSDFDNNYLAVYGGLSLTYWVSKSVGITAQTVNKYYSDDIIESTPPGISYYQYSLGVSFGIGDGDADADGVKDSVDACPDVAGLPALGGCPDDDNDGVVNDDDDCPNIPGLASMNGCPDGDNDGVIDQDDNCPELPGLVALNGCPDSDGDGIIDPNDDCPNDKGTEENNGCPDSDNDGIVDSQDNCPNTQGPSSNNGCPLKPLSDLDNLSVLFDVSSTSILDANQSVLDEVISILNDHPNASLTLVGHTDNSGAEKYNTNLSLQRAQSVADYLVANGVSADKIQIEGKGESEPKASNKTNEGKAQNRRVDFAAN